MIRALIEILTLIQPLLFTDGTATFPRIRAKRKLPLCELIAYSICAVRAHRFRPVTEELRDDLLAHIWVMAGDDSCFHHVVVFFVW